MLTRRQLLSRAGAAGAALGPPLYTNPRYDSGLCETAATGGSPRPAYAAWKALPSIA